MRALLALAASLGILLTPRLTPACEVSPEIRAALDERDFASAERLARADIAGDPERVEPRLALAHVYVEWSREPGDAEHSAQAVEVLAETVQRWPGVLRPRVCLLELRQFRKETEPFFVALDATLRQFPEPSPELAGSLERLLRRFLLDNLDASAERMCQIVSGRADATVPLLSNCGLSALRQENLDTALVRMHLARKGDPDDLLVAHNLAMMQILSGDLAAAAATLGELDALDRAYPQDALALAVVATAREPGASLPAWRRAVSRLGDPAAPPEARPLLEWARQTEAAVAEGGELNGYSLAAMARALMSSQPTLAVALAHGAASRAPTDPSFPYLLAQAMEANRLDWLAFEALERAAALPPHDDSALDIPPGAIALEAGRVATKVGRYADAVVHLEQARAVRADFPNLQYLLGHAYEGIGDHAAAERSYRECLTQPNNHSDYTSWCEKNVARLASVPGAPTPTSDFEGPLAKARASEASAAGKAYVSSVRPALGPRLGEAVAACIPWRPEGGDSAARTLLVRIAADGSVAEARLAEDGRESACFAASLRGALAPAPPAADWWLVYDITIE